MGEPPDHNAAMAAEALDTLRLMLMDGDKNDASGGEPKV
jgi:hypothetical protein